MAGTGLEIEFGHEGSFRQAHDHEDPAGIDGNLASAPGTRETNLWRVIVPDYRRIEVAETVNLRPAKQRNIDQAALQVKHEQVRHADYGRCPTYQGGIADRKGQPRRLGPKDAALINQLHVRRVAPSSEITGDIWQPDADKYGPVTFQCSRAGDDHEL